MNIPKDVGIWRIDIQSDFGKSKQARLSRRMAPRLDDWYFGVFAHKLNMPLRPNILIERPTKADAVARYDWGDGVDRKLIQVDGTIWTVQEKVLTYTNLTTVTIETQKPSGEPGFWHYGTAQLYTVVYVKNEIGLEIRNWIILNLPLVRQSKDIHWEERPNGQGGLFRYAEFRAFPPETVVASMISQGELFYNPMAIEPTRRAAA